MSVALEMVPQQVGEGGVRLGGVVGVPGDLNQPLEDGKDGGPGVGGGGGADDGGLESDRAAKASEEGGELILEAFAGGEGEVESGEEELEGSGDVAGGGEGGPERGEGVGLEVEVDGLEGGGLGGAVEGRGGAGEGGAGSGGEEAGEARVGVAAAVVSGWALAERRLRLRRPAAFHGGGGGGGGSKRWELWRRGLLGKKGGRVFGFSQIPAFGRH